jgi:hypothetical protein
VARSNIVVARAALPELVADALPVYHKRVFNTCVAVAGIWAIAVGWMVVVIATAWVARSVVDVTGVTLETVLTLTGAVEVSLGVVVTLQATFATAIRATVSMIADGMAGVHVQPYATVVPSPVGITDTGVVVIAVGMRHTLNTVGRIRANTVTITEVVAPPSVDIRPTIRTGPVRLALTVPVEVLKGVRLTGNAVLCRGACTAIIADWITDALVNECLAVLSSPLEVADALSMLVLGCVFDTVITVSRLWP